MRRLLIALFVLLTLPAMAQVESFHSFDYPGEPSVYVLNTTAETADNFTASDEGYNYYFFYAMNSGGTGAVYTGGTACDFTSNATLSSGNYTVAMDATTGASIASLTTNTGFGVTARVTLPSATNFTSWTNTTKGGLETGYQFGYVGGKWAITLLDPIEFKNGTVLGTSTAVTLAVSTTYRLQFVLNGTTLQGYANGVLVASATDSTYAAGQAGIYCNGTAAEVTNDNFLVTNSTTAQDAAYPTVPISTVGTTVHLVGNNTAWTSGTTFALATAPAGTSITATTFVDATHVTLTLTTGATAGAMTISDSTDAAIASATVIPVSQTYNEASTYFGYSPVNWYGDSGRGGTVYHETWNPGAYIKMRVALGTYNPSIVLHFDTTPWGTFTTPNWSALAAPAPYIIEYIDGAYANKFLADGAANNGNLTVQVTGNIYNCNNPSNAHTYMFIFGGCATGSRWETAAGTATGVLRFTGATVDGGATMYAPVMATKWAMLYGTSITEGLQSGSAPVLLQGYAWDMTQKLLADGYEVGYDATYGDNLDTGTAISPSLTPSMYQLTGSTNGSGGTYVDSTSRWDHITGWVSDKDSNGDISGWGGTGQAPSLVWIEEDTNDVWDNMSDLKSCTNGFLTALRTACPAAKILWLPIPTIDNQGAYYAGQGVTFTSLCMSFLQNYKTLSGDNNFYIWQGNAQALSATIQNYPSGTPDHLHPSGVTHPYLAAQAIDFLDSVIDNPGGVSKAPTDHGVVH